jgi:hypothetical protein
MIWAAAGLAAIWFMAGFLVGQRQQSILDALKKVLEREVEPEPAITAPLPPEEVRYGGASIVTPRSPLEIELAMEREVERKIKEAGNG